MLAKLGALMDSYVKNSEAEMFFRVFSGNKKIVDIQAFNLKSLFCGSKRNKRIKLHTNKAIMFLQSLLLLTRVSLISKKLFDENRYIS